MSTKTPTVVVIAMTTQTRKLVLLSRLLLLLQTLPYYYVHCFVDNNNSANCECADQPVQRNSFPDGFVFGAGTSAYQVEGAYNKDGKGLSTWDYYTNEHPERIADGSSGNVAANSYSQYKEDVRIAKEMGLDAYRFSISWPRILPHGRLYGGRVNLKGVEYYNKLIDELLLNGIKPYATLFHWDVPLTLEQQYGGFLSRRIVDDFSYYTDICFEYFGDRVKNWTTLNEPQGTSELGYSLGVYAPGRCSNHTNCLGGDSGTEPYIVAHNQLLAHAAAIQLYRQKYQAHQSGCIGITLSSKWYLPYSNSTADQEAQKRALDFQLGWFMDPIVFGTYPESMRVGVGSRLPSFSPSESRMLKGSFDFIGINYYTSNYAKDEPHDRNEGPFSYTTDNQLTSSEIRDGIPIGRQTDSTWLYIYPRGIWKLLDYIRITYNDPQLVITENGIGDANNPAIKLEEALNDNLRVESMHDHMCCLLDAIKGGIQLKGYFAWSLLDNFEWDSGYTSRFGLNYVDFKNNFTRYPKKSAIWYKNIISTESTVLTKNTISLKENNFSVLSMA